MSSPKGLHSGLRNIDLIEIGKSGTTPEYWREYVDRDRPVDMRETILMQNYNLVLKVFHSFKQEAFGCLKGSESDTIHEGVVGLIKAIERYDPERGKFSTFAYPYIKGAILQYIRDKHYPVKFSQVKSERVIRYWKAMTKLQGTNLSIDRVDFRLCLPALEVLFNKAKEQMTNEKDRELSFEAWTNDVLLYMNCRNILYEDKCEESQGVNQGVNITWLFKDYLSFEGDRFLTPPSQIDPRVYRVMEKIAE